MKVQRKFSNIRPECSEHARPSHGFGNEGVSTPEDGQANGPAGELTARVSGLLDRRHRPNPPLPDSLIDIPGTAETLGVSVRTIYALMAKGMLQPVRVLGRTLFDPADVRAFIERAKQRGSTPRQEGGAE